MASAATSATASVRAAARQGLPVVNVMRYTGLVGGIAYGAYYQYSLQKQADREAWEAQKRKRERWVRQARKIYQEKYGKPTGLITDPEDSGFDLEKLLLSLENEK